MGEYLDKVALAVAAGVAPSGGSVRPYVRQEHGVEQHVGGYGRQHSGIQPAVNESSVEEHLRYAHGMGAQPHHLAGQSTMSPGEMLKFHDSLHMRGHQHEAYIPKRNIGTGVERGTRQEFMAQMHTARNAPPIREGELSQHPLHDLLRQHLDARYGPGFKAR